MFLNSGLFRGTTAIGLAGMTPVLAQTYSITDVSPAQAYWAAATDVNNAGQISGWMFTRVYDRYGFMWQNGVAGIATPQGSQAMAINAGGDMTGMLFLGGAIWNTNGMTYTFYSPGVSESGFGINSSRVACGEYYLDWSWSPTAPFVYQSGPTVTPLAFPGQPADGSARGINDAGQITGWAMQGTSYHMFCYQGGTMQDCGLYPGATGVTDTAGYAITSAGMIAGSYTRATLTHAVLHNMADGTWQALAEPAGGSASVALAINESQRVVGEITYTDGATHGFVWDAVHGMRDLNTLIPPGLGYVITSAAGINDQGWIVGQAQAGTYARGVLLRPNACPGDIDQSGGVDLADLAILLAHFGMTGVTPADGDLDGDTEVDLSDLSSLLSTFGATC